MLSGGADAPQANLSDSVVVGEDASNVGADTNFDRAAEAVGRMVDGAAESLEEDLKVCEILSLSLSLFEFY